jgi:hypothetical protein
LRREATLVELIFFESEPSRTESVELVETDLRLGAILVIMVLGALVVGDYVLSSQVKGALDVKVTERTTTVFLDGRVNVEVEVVITNNHNLDTKLRDATLTTYIGGNRVGLETLEQLTIKGNSETIIIFNVKENWSEVPVTEPSMLPTYDFEMTTKTFLFENRFEKRTLFTTITSETPTETQWKNETAEEQIRGRVTDETLLDEFAKNVRSGGPPKDGIPPIDEPKYVTVQEVKETLDDDDVVFILESSDPVKIYPQYILVYHEIVNEELEGKSISITYCPLTGSVIAYKGDIQTMETTFGTSGELLNSNLVMYDRVTNSYWPQILGTAINGPSKGEDLETTSIAWTRWGLAKALYPNAMVLSEKTGFLRNYGNDPYGAYTEDDSYYQTGGPFFPVMNIDKRLPSKEVVIGIKTGGALLAVTKSSVADVGVLNLELGENPFVAIYDKSLEAVRVYSRRVNGETLEFSLRNGVILDDSASFWTAKGQALEGTYKGESLSPVTYFDVMWFAWSAFYPETELIQ